MKLGELSVLRLKHDYVVVFGVRAVLGIVVPLALAVRLRRLPGPASTGLYGLLFVSLLVGETVARVLFYAAAVHVSATMSVLREVFA